MTDWIVRLQGDAFDLEGLPDLFEGTSYRVFKEGEHYYLWSSEFQNLADAYSVHERAVATLEVLNGAAAAILNNARPIDVGAVVHIDAEGTRKASVFASAHSVVRTRARATVEVTGGKIRRESGKHWELDRVISDEKVQRALRIFGTVPRNWPSLYNVFEIIQSDVGGGMVKLRWTTTGELRRFKHSANSPAAVGRDARHGFDKDEPPENPMTLTEANGFIVGILRRWLNWKGTPQSP